MIIILKLKMPKNFFVKGDKVKFTVNLKEEKCNIFN